MAENLSFVLEKPGSVKFETRPTPSLPDPYHVQINVKFTGICGSDIHYWQHGRIGDFVVTSPMVLGHESSGIITAVGSAVTTLKVGDRVCLEPGIPCRRCLRCKEGKYNLCPRMAFAATPPHDGTLAKYYVLPEDFCYKLSDLTSLEEGALMEPLSVAVHIVRQAGVRPGESVVVFGAGPVGLLCCAVARAYGGSKIVAVDLNAQRLDFATKYAATHAVASRTDESPQEAADRINSSCELGGGADVVIDATGAAVCVQTALLAIRIGGTYVQAGMGKAELDNFPIMALCTKELNVKGSFRYGPGDYATAVDLLASGRVSVKELITGKVKFRDAEAAFRDVRDAKGIKMLIEGVEDTDNINGNSH